MTKKKCRQYSIEYIAHGFIPSPRDERMPLYIIYMTTLSNESKAAMKAADALGDNPRGQEA
jgi:hypothetical protein